jgi:hypothetical protein
MDSRRAIDYRPLQNGAKPLMRCGLTIASAGLDKVQPLGGK